MADVDVQVEFGTKPPWYGQLRQHWVAPWYSSPLVDETGEPHLTVWQVRDGAYFRFLYGSGHEFIVDSAGTEVWGNWSAGGALADTSAFLLGPILGFVLGLRGTACLHASCVNVDDRALVVLGASGAGKSTTAAALAGQGFPVVSDDVLPLREEGDSFFVEPAYPRLRLWPDSAECLFGEDQSLPRLAPIWDKRFLDLGQEGYRFQRESLPLTAIYILNQRQDDRAAPYVEVASGRTGLVNLIAGTYANYLLNRFRRAQDFELFGRLVERVPLRQVTPHQDPALLPKLCEVILDDFRAINASGCC